MSKILNIYNEDGSLYWKEHFNRQEDLDKWLEEEKTRPYWNKNFVTEIEDIPQPDLSEREDQMQKIQEKKQSAKEKLLALGLDEEEISALLGL
jgi:hypothetical protein